MLGGEVGLGVTMGGDQPPTDIWSTGFSFESPLKDLLDRGGYTVEELLAEDELLQELRGCHPQLIAFFSSEEAVLKLVEHVVQLPTSSSKLAVEEGSGETDASTGETTKDDDDEVGTEDGELDEVEQARLAADSPSKEDRVGEWLNPGEDPTPKVPIASEEELVTIRYPYMACEVICSEVNSIIDILVEGRLPLDYSLVSTDTGVKGDLDQLEQPQRKPRLILDLLFHMLYETRAGELDDYRAGYFDKILSVLCRKKPQQLTTYINEGGTRGHVVMMQQAMMKHLYSHSILQVVQRLLLPVQPGSGANNNNSSTINDNDGGGPVVSSWGTGANVDDDDEDDEEDDNNVFRCRWSESPESIEFLLDALTGLGKLATSSDDQELRLYEAQNASEVLITVIQNSPLTSPTMISLTTDPFLERIVRAASTLPEGEDFSPHDSTLTCALNVFESLVLQLGGYGSVGTETNPVGILPSPPLASAETLLSHHLEGALNNLGNLLRHESTASWQSPTQFSKEEPQQILGTSRLRIVRLIESLVLLGHPAVDKVLCTTSCLGICLQLFWEFEWCSMLHQSVANLLVHVFEGANARADLQEFFLVNCDLLSRLVDCFDVEDDEIDDEIEEDLLLENASTTTTTTSGCSNNVDDANSPHKEPRLSDVVKHVVGDDSEQGSLVSGDSAKSADSAVSVDSAVSCDSAASGDSGDSTAVLADGEAPLTVSDDDVEAALEQQQEEQTAAAAPNTRLSSSASQSLSSDAMSTGVDAPSHLPSLRKGYMGHVIIICQALVHASTSTPNENSNGASLGEGSSDNLGLSNSSGNNSVGKMAVVMNGGDVQPELQDETAVDAEEIQRSENGLALADDDAGDESSYVDSEGAQPTLVIAQLINSHAMRERWHEFVSTTLASETAIQSTPLGGFNAAAMTIDPLQAHRPPMNELSGMFNDGHDDDDDDMPVERGLSGGGDVLDMDDNDIEVAASMMEALSLPSRGGGAVHHQGEFDAPSASDYMFDDPLGNNNNQRFGSEFRDDSDSSDDDDDDQAPAYMRRSSSGDSDPPVMDLFAGNMMNGEPGGSVGSGFADFASFDDAFAAAGGSPTSDAGTAGEDLFASHPASSGHTDEDDDPFATSSAGDSDRSDDFFGSSGSHEFLLDEPETKAADDPFADDQGQGNAARKDKAPFLLDETDAPAKGDEPGERTTSGDSSSENTKGPTQDEEAVEESISTFETGREEKKNGTSENSSAEKISKGHQRDQREQGDDPVDDPTLVN